MRVYVCPFAGSYLSCRPHAPKQDSKSTFRIFYISVVKKCCSNCGDVGNAQVESCLFFVSMSQPFLAASATGKTWGGGGEEEMIA